MADQTPDTQPEAVTEEDRTAIIGTETESEYGTIKHVSIVDEMEQAYLDYAMSVIVSRALPDVRDGLKPVHRRILFSMYKAGIRHSSSYKKSARIVGDVLGKYHPHGDSAVYMALVRLAQDFSIRYPLVDGQGNFGSIDGDSPAAMRYTEARLAKITEELLVDIDKETVDFVDNFDGSMQEPTVLPSKLPNLLLMGAEGIAVGMATKIPPHNLTEVGNAVLAAIDNGEATIPEEAFEEGATGADGAMQNSANDIDKQAPGYKNVGDTDIMDTALIEQILNTPSLQLAGTFRSEITIDQILEHVKGPDFPTAGIMYDFEEIKKGYQTGKGRVVMRAKADIVEGSGSSYEIHVTELPYQVNKTRLIKKIADLVRDKRVEGIRDINDHSDRNGMQITIELKRDARPRVVLNKLFKYSNLQKTFSMNVVALNSDGTPQLMNIKQILNEYISHRQLVITRRSQYELGKAHDRAHILEGLIIALNNLDEVIETIRNSADTDTAKNSLMEKFGLSEVQSLAILDMQLKRLAALERQKIEDEYEAIKVQIEELLALLQDPQAILRKVSEEMQEMIDIYGDKRKTRLVYGKVGELSEQDLVANEETVITLTEGGYIKRMSPGSFRSQARGGKGAKGLTTKADDVLKTILMAQTHDTMLLFTNQGRIFEMKVYEMNESSRQAKGTALVNLVNLRHDETVQSLLLLDEEKDQDKFITLATRKGQIKKTAVSEYSNIRQNGIIAISLNDGDELVSGCLTSGEYHLMLVTYKGKSIRFEESEVKDSGRNTKGVKGINLKKDDFLVAMECFDPEVEAPDDGRVRWFRHLFVVTENGMGKRTELDEYPVQKRGGMGVKVADITKKTGNVAAARLVTHADDEVVLTTEKGQAIKMPLLQKSIPVLTRPTQGVILMRTKGNDKIVAVATTLREDE